MAEKDKESIVESEFRIDIDQFKSAMKDVMTELKEVESETKKVNKNIKEDSAKQGNSIKDLFGNIIKGWQSFSFNTFIFTMMIKQITGFVSSLSELAKKSDQAKLSMIGLKSVAESFGEDGGAAQKAAKEIVKLTGGMVNLQQAGQGLKSLISSGYSVKEAFDLSKSMLEIGAFNNVVGDLGQAYTDATKGIKTGSVELTENIGLTQRLSSVMKQAGISIENGIDVTNNASQRQALYNSIIKQGANFTGDLKKVQDEYTGAMAKFQLEIDTFIRNIGKMVQPIVKVGAVIIENLVKPFNKMFKIDDTSISEQILDLTLEMDKLQKITKPTADEQKRLKDVMNEMAILSPGMVTSYDNLGNAQINMASATKVVIDMKKLEVEQSKKQLEQDKKLTEQLIKNLDKKIAKYDSYLAMAQSGIETTSAEFARFQLNVAKENKKNIQDLTLEEMLSYATKTNASFVNATGEVVKLKETLGVAVKIKDNYIAQLKNEKSILEETKKTQENVLVGYKDFLKLDTSKAFKKLEETREKTKLKTDITPDKQKYDAIEASKDFFRTQELEYEKNISDFATRRAELDEQYKNKEKDEVYKKALEMIKVEENANLLVFNKAKEIRESIKKSDSANTTQDIKQKFDLAKVAIEKDSEIAMARLGVQKEYAEELANEREKEAQKLQTQLKEQEQRKLKLENQLKDDEFKAMQDLAEAESELEVQLILEKLALKQSLTQKEIDLTNEMLSAKTYEENQALEESFQEKLNKFESEATEESVKKQNILKAQIEKEKIAKEEFKQAQEDIKNYELGNIQLRDDTLKQYKNLSDQQRQVLEKELAEKKKYASENIDWKNVVENTERGFTDTKNELIEKLYNNEKVGWAEMREMLNENLRDGLIIEGQKLAGIAISETVQGFVAMANPVTKPLAKGHFVAAAQASAGALALGAISRTISASESSGSSGSTNTSESTGLTGSTGGTTTETEKVTEIHVHNTSLKKIVTELIEPELVNLVKDGQSKIVLAND